MAVPPILWPSHAMRTDIIMSIIICARHGFGIYGIQMPGSWPQIG